MTEEMQGSHTPVLLEEAIDALCPRAHGKYLDGTVGLGGHAAALLERAPYSRLCGLDRDMHALDLARKRLSPFGDRVDLFHLEFGDFDRALIALGWDSIDGAILDLGVSSLQLDTAERGFSFRSSGPLDMRMNDSGSECTAAHLVNRLSHEKLKEIISAYGEDPQAGRIARKIIDAREKAPIETTAELADIVWNAYPAAWRKKARRHPATRVFQALRMTVNDELGQLEKFLAKILSWLAPGGRLVVISFHSLEDRMVKHCMRDWAKDCICPREAMICTCGHTPEVKPLFKKPVTPTPEEVALNPRASSAKLRAMEKI